MNILLVTPWRPSLTGGISTVIARLTEEFRKKGHDVIIFVADRDNVLCQVERLEGTPVYGMYLRSPTAANYPFRAAVMCWMCFPLTMGQLLWLIWRRQVEAIIIQYPLPNMFYFAFIKWFLEVKLLVAYQGNDAHDLHLWTSQERGLVRYLLGKADAVIGVSQTLLDKVERMFPGLQLKRSGVLPNGAPLDAIHQVEPTKLGGELPPEFVFTAGHLIHRKGMDVVIDGIKVAKSLGITVRVVVAGDGPQKDVLLRQARDVAVSDQVIFLGNQTQVEVLGHMKACLFFILASRAEGMPLVIAEAMACGKAVVATRVDGIPEIVQDGVTGILVPAEDADSLGAAMVKVYVDSSYREALAKRGKEWALREYNWGSIANRYLYLIEECKAP